MEAYDILRLPPLYIGRAMDNGVNEICINCASWLAIYPMIKDYRIEVRSPANAMYIAAGTYMRGSLLVWPITDSDTAAAGVGEYQIVAIGADGERMTSACMPLHVAAIMPGSAGDVPPEPARPWTDAVVDAARDAQDAARVAQDAVGSLSGMLEDCKADIINSLCPEMTDMSVDVLCYPVAGSTLGKAVVRWIPIQDGEGTPKPVNIRPLRARSSVALTLRGKNILSGDSVVENGRFWLGTKSWKVPGLYIQNETAYTFSVDKPFTHECVLTFSSASMYTKTESASLTVKPGETVKKLKLPAAMPSGAYRAELAIKSSPSKWIPQPFTRWQLELGREQNEYEPYVGHVRQAHISDTVYGGEWDAVSGRVMSDYHAHTFDGTEDWVLENDGKNLVWRTPLPRYDDTAVNGSSNQNGLCTHYSYVRDRYGYGIYAMTEADSTTVGYALGEHPTADYGTVEAWKAYLAEQKANGTPVTIIYKIAQPQHVATVGGAPMYAVVGINDVMGDADSVLVRYRADPARVLDGLTARIEALENSSATIDKA